MLIEPGELAVGAEVAAVDRDDLLERLGGAVELAEPLLPGRGHALVERHPLGVGARRVELRLEDLLNMQAASQFVLEQGKLKLNVDKTLLFLNEKMRF